MISIAWLIATVWAHKTNRDPILYGAMAAVFSFLEATGFWVWMTQ